MLEILKLNTMRKINALFVFYILSSMACTKQDNFVPDPNTAGATSETSKQELTNEYAKVDQIQGLFIFIEATPVKEYQSLGKITNEGYVEITEHDSTTSRKRVRGAWVVLKADQKNLNYSERLHMMIGKVRAEFPQADGIIFYDRITRCEAIKFQKEDNQIQKDSKALLEKSTLE